MTDPVDPREALAEIGAARQGMAADLKYPLYYDLLYGLLCGMIVAGQGLPQPWSLLVLVLALMGLAIFVASWRKRYGWWVNGYSPRRARWVAYGLAAVFVLLVGVSLGGRLAGFWWISLVTGPLGFAAAILGGRLWLSVWRRDLMDENA